MRRVFLYFCSGKAQLVERSTLMRKYPRSIPGYGEKKYSIFYWKYIWAISTQVRIEHDLPLPMILMGEPLANLSNYVIEVIPRCVLLSIWSVENFCISTILFYFRASSIFCRLANTIVLVCILAFAKAKAKTLLRIKLELIEQI